MNADDEIKSLMVKNNITGIIRLGIHLTLIFVMAYLLGRSGYRAVDFVIMILLGILIAFLFAPLHECIHKTAFKSPRLNSVVAAICGFVIFLPSRYFRSFHMAHHRFTQIKGKDPELDSEKPENFSRYLLHVSGLMYWLEQAKTIAICAFGKVGHHFVAVPHRKKIVNEARVCVTLYTALIIIMIGFDVGEILTCWLIPLLLGQPFLRIFLIAEHTLCPRHRSMYENTRTTLTNKPMRFLCWNMCYHVEHHVYPAIPFHNLADAHRIIRDNIRHLSCGYIAVNRQIINSL